MIAHRTMIRLGLCCIFRDEPIKFRTTTATAIKRLPRDEGRKKLADLCAANAAALMEALQFCSANGIGCFRVNSQILPVKTHPEVGYDIEELPGRAANRRRSFGSAGSSPKPLGCGPPSIPDQFVVLNSPKPDVVEKSIQEIEYQAEVAQWIGADVINIHGGGAYGDKQTALERFAEESCPIVKGRPQVAHGRERRQDLHARRSAAALQGRRHAARLRCPSSPLQPRWHERRTSHQEGTGDLEPRTAVPYFQPD